MSILGLVFWFGGLAASRIETPDQKEARIKRFIDPINAEMMNMRNRMRTHEFIDGHHVMMERVAELQNRVQRTDEKIDALDREITKDFIRKDELPRLLQGRTP